MSAPVHIPAVVVGNNPDPISFVRGADGARRYAIPLKIKPALGHVPENGSHPVRKERCHVLHDCVFRSYQAKGSHQFPVESRTLSGNAGAFSSAGDILTGETADNDIGVWELSGSDIAEDRDARPVFGENATAKGVDFAESDCSHSDALKAEAEASDAAKKVKNAHL